MELEDNKLPLEYKKCYWEFKSDHLYCTRASCSFKAKYSDHSRMVCRRCGSPLERPTWLVTVDRKTGQLLCDCPGFTYRGTCWHVRRIMSLKLQALEGYTYEREWVGEVMQLSNRILLPHLPLGEPFSMPFLITIVYDLLQLGHKMIQIRDLYPVVPRKWMQKHIEDYIEENGRYKPNVESYIQAQKIRRELRRDSGLNPGESPPR